MASSKDFPGGDYTESANFPKIVYGQPDKADILSAQNIVAGKAFAAEAKENAAFRQEMRDQMKSMIEMQKLGLASGGVEDDRIAALSPTKGSPTRAGKEAMSQLGNEFHDAIYDATESFAGDDDSKMLTVRTARTELTVKDWLTAVKEYLQEENEDHAETLENLDEDQLIALYIKACKAIKRVRKAAKGKAAEAAAKTSQRPEFGEEVEAVVNAIDAEVQTEVVKITKEAQENNSTVFDFDHADDAALTAMMETWMSVLEDAFGTNQGDLLLIQGLGDDARKAFFFRALDQITAQEKDAQAGALLEKFEHHADKSNLFNEKKLDAFNKDFVLKAFAETCKLYVTQPTKVHVKKGKNILISVTWWFNKMKLDDTVATVVDASGKKYIAIFNDLAETPRIDAYLAFTQAARTATSADSTLVPAPVGRDSSPEKGDKTAKPALTLQTGSTNPLANAPDLSPGASLAVLASKVLVLGARRRKDAEEFPVAPLAVVVATRVVVAVVATSSMMMKRMKTSCRELPPMLCCN